MKVRRIHVLVVALGLALALIPFHAKFRSVAMSVIQMPKGRKTVPERIAEFGGAVHNRLAPRFGEIGAAYPPK
jgi:hypothetical protein